MAGQPQAKNELGKLFVDIGINGVGKVLKGLNSVSATFLLGKNAANQFVQSIAQPFKEAGNSAVGIGKMSNALATSSMEYQKLAMYLKRYNLSEDLLGDVSKLEQTFYDLSQGFANLQGSLAVGLGQAGLNAKDYKGTFEDTMKMLDDLQKATAGMTKNKRNQILRQIGISSDWGYLFDKGGRAGDYLTISDEAIKTNQSLAESMSNLRNTLENLWQETLSKMAPAIIKISDILTEWSKNFVQGGGLDKTTNAIKGVYETTKTNAGGMNPLNVIPAVGVVNAIRGVKNGTTTGQAADLGYVGNLPSIGQPTGGAAMITNNISHDITITGDNAEDIANKIAAISAQDIQYSQYQANNLPGL